MFLGTVIVLILAAAVFLLVWVGLGFTAGEIMVNPNARPDDRTQLERAANIAFSFFAIVEMMLAYVTVRSGLLQTRLHWLARAVGTLVVGSILSWLIVMGTIWFGLPPFIAGLERTLTTWIQNLA